MNDQVNNEEVGRKEKTTMKKGRVTVGNKE